MLRSNGILPAPAVRRAHRHERSSPRYNVGFTKSRTPLTPQAERPGAAPPGARSARAG
jgi:hypothetical protein